MELGVGAIGGKDSMSGSFEKLDVPPTLVSFAVDHRQDRRGRLPRIQGRGPQGLPADPAPTTTNGLPETASLLEIFDTVTELIRSGKAVAAYTPGMGGVGGGRDEDGLRQRLRLRL